ncbi:MAG: hypothetical protein JWL77_518 [Chthonomonadaceae bacterium]|nr:hypothetical protein [Chthonomonadaceae bacterium]
MWRPVGCQKARFVFGRSEWLTHRAYVAVLLFVLLLCPIDGWGQGSDLAIEVVPASVELTHEEPSGTQRPRTEPVKVWILVHNPTAETLHKVRISWLNQEGAHLTWASPAQQVPRSLSPHQDFAYTLVVTPDSAADVSSTLPLRVDYATRSGSRIAHASLTVKPMESLSAEKVLDVQVKTPGEPLQERRPARMYLVLTNKSGVPVEIGPVVSEGPPFLQFGAPVEIRAATYKGSPRMTSDASPSHLDPGETRTLAIDVAAKDRVKQGKQLLVFSIPVTWTQGHQVQRRIRVVTQAVTVGVLGETGLLTLLAVPSFLVLPGFLFLGTLGLFQRLIGSRRDDEKDADGTWPLKTVRDFWIVAITLSGLAIGLLGPWWNLLDGYGFNDIVRVWCVAFLLGFLTYITYYAWEQGITIKPGDAPLTVLEKLGRRHRVSQLWRTFVHVWRRLRRLDPFRSTVLERVTLEDGSTAYVLPYRGKDKLIAPRMTFDRAKLSVALGDQITTQIDRGDAGALAKLLRAGSIEVRWKNLAGLVGPSLVDAAKVKAADGRSII